MKPAKKATPEDCLALAKAGMVSSPEAREARRTELLKEMEHLRFRLSETYATRTQERRPSIRKRYEQKAASLDKKLRDKGKQLRTIDEARKKWEAGGCAPTPRAPAPPAK